MPSTRLSQPRPDCLVFEQGRDVRRALLWALPGVAWGLTFATAGAWLSGDGARMAWVALGMAVLPFTVIRGLRTLRRQDYTLVRAQGRLLLDGEPLEMARIELRVERRPITRVPRGYSLSLWVMTVTGPRDLPLGHYADLVAASRVSGTVEDFVQRAGNRQPRHV